MDVPKNSMTSSSANDGEFDRSMTTSAPRMASARPSPVRVLTPEFGDAGTTSWPCASSLPATFEPISPLAPMTTILMVLLPVVSLYRGDRAGASVCDMSRTRACLRSVPVDPDRRCHMSPRLLYLLSSLRTHHALRIPRPRCA